MNESQSPLSKIQRHAQAFAGSYDALFDAILSPNGSVIPFEPNLDRLEIVYEFDELKKQFPNDYRKYLEEYLEVYGMMQRTVDILFVRTENLEAMREKVAESLMKNPNEMSQEFYYLRLKEYVDYIVNYLETALISAGKVVNEVGIPSKNVKGLSVLNREQTALLFWYMREMRLINQPTNGNLAKAIQILTGYSAKQMQDILKSPGTDVRFFGKDGNGLRRTDYKVLIGTLEKLLEIVKKDYRTNSENNELR